MDWQLVIGSGVVVIAIAVFSYFTHRKLTRTPVVEPGGRKREELQDFLNEPTPLPEKAPVLVQADIPVRRDRPKVAVVKKAKPKIKAKRRAF